MLKSSQSIALPKHQSFNFFSVCVCVYVFNKLFFSESIKFSSIDLSHEVSLPAKGNSKGNPRVYNKNQRVTSLHHSQLIR